MVYNHFGPDGNYLGAYAPEFYHPENHTAWGAAIAYDREPVRRFMIDNALYWLREYRIDGLRLDAIDSIEDHSEVDIVEDIAPRRAPGGGRRRARLAPPPDHGGRAQHHGASRARGARRPPLRAALRRRVERRLPQRRPCA